MNEPSTTRYAGNSVDFWLGIGRVLAVPSDSEVLETVSAVLADATSSRVEISMGIYRRLLGQPLKTTDDTIGLVSVRRLRAERKKFLTAAVARKLGGR